MKTLIVILLTILIVLLLSASATLIYYLIYRKAIKKKIEAGLGNNTKKRRFLNPLLMKIFNHLGYACGKSHRFYSQR